MALVYQALNDILSKMKNLRGLFASSQFWFDDDKFQYFNYAVVVIFMISAHKTVHLMGLLFSVQYT